MKVLIVNNLQSGLRDGSIFEFARKFAQDGDELTIRNTDGRTAIATLLDDAKACDLVVAAGGDGTIAAVCYELRFTGLPILPFPAGTGNLLAMNLDQPDEPSALVDMARAMRTLDFDLGELVYDTDEGTTTKGFIVIGGAGYDATIMENSERLKEALGAGAYVAAAIANPSPTVARFSISLDDRTVKIDSMAVLVLNFAKIYPDISLSYDNDARDGLFEIAVLKPHTAVELLPALFAAFLERGEGSPYRADAVEVFKSKIVRVESDPPLHLQYDGEAPGCKTPFVARVLPAATRLVVTEQEFLRLSKG